MHLGCGIIIFVYVQEQGDANGDYDSITNSVHHIALLSCDISCVLFYPSAEQAAGADSTPANEEEG
jgi:hypothetical protein